MRSTSSLRTLWGPPCSGPWARVDLYGDGAVTVRASVVDAVRALNSCLVRHDYPTRRMDTGAYVCRAITGGVGYSLHAYGIALDLNWQTNPYGPTLVTDMPPAMVAAIKAIRTRSGAVVWRWGGDFAGNKDAMHYEVVASPQEIASGIDPASVWAPSPPVVPPDVPVEEDDDMFAIMTAPGREWFVVENGVRKRPVGNGDAIPTWVGLGAKVGPGNAPIMLPVEELDAIPLVS